MQVNIQKQGAFASALVKLSPGEEFVSDAGAMYRCSTNVDIDVTTKSRGSGGFFGGLKRLLSGETFFLSTYRITDSSTGEVGLAPTHMGEIWAIEMDGSVDWMCAGGSYLGSTAGLQLDTEFQGFKGFFSGEAPFFLRVSGRGTLLVAAFGRISEQNLNGDMIIDTGHVVAFEDTMEYKLSKAGSSWFQSFLAGEGIVLDFEGEGKILTQSQNLKDFGKDLGPRLPPR
ncbi:MAG: TIGR00266 family protein [Planctomycetaceae bacterium]|nr:TIGR00266 family protein [Planctomycetaceae bacterium]MCA9043101.1 TIGR00266 family protein [Planctomycetaceae bacterium]MCB9953722.1 TIGR00266 family protein [Planctomycetaceae bacterium]